MSLKPLVKEVVFQKSSIQYYHQQFDTWPIGKFLRALDIPHCPNPFKDPSFYILGPVDTLTDCDPDQVCGPVRIMFTLETNEDDPQKIRRQHFSFKKKDLIWGVFTFFAFTSNNWYTDDTLEGSSSELRWVFYLNETPLPYGSQMLWAAYDDVLLLSFYKSLLEKIQTLDCQLEDLVMLSIVFSSSPGGAECWFVNQGRKLCILSKDTEDGVDF